MGNLLSVLFEILLGVLTPAKRGDALFDDVDGDASDTRKEIPYWDQGGTNDWHYRQWDFSD